MDNDLISRKVLMQELESLKISITGVQERKEFQKIVEEVMKSVLRIVDEQPAAFKKVIVIKELRDEAKRWHESGVAYDDEKEKGVAEGFRLSANIVEKGGIAT